MYFVAIDTETDLIGPGNVIPKLICMTTATHTPDGEVERGIYGNGDEELEEVLRFLLEDDEARLIFCNAGFDLAVLRRAFPHLTSALWAKAAAGHLITDVAIREQLHNLTTHGNLKKLYLPDGESISLEYSLAALAKSHLGVDLSALKDPTIEDNWRLNYHTLDGMKAADYPEEAREYAMDDALYTLMIYDAQRAEWGPDTDTDEGYGSTRAEYFKSALSFALYLISARGMRTDPEEVAKLEEWIAAEMVPEKLELLFETGILRNPQPARPPLNASKKLNEVLDDVQWSKDLIATYPFTSEELAKCREAGIRTTKAKPASKDTKVLHQWVIDLCEQHDITVQYTDPSSKFPEGQVSTDGDVVAKLAPLCPVMEQFQHRQGLVQIADTEIPRLQAPVVHFNYRPVVETYRTSSHGAQKGRELYPCTNGQNVNPRVRQAYVARPGHVLCSVDYSSLELCTLAQTCFDLFGQSVMMEMINRGVDLHSYLGAQIALHLEPDFAAAVKEIASDPLKVYEAFVKLHDSDNEVWQEFYYKYRNKMSKPTGLGYPGGLGPQTFITFARGYGLTVDLETAQQLREIWFDTYPEMKLYFEWISSNCQDPVNVGEVDPDTGHRRQRYAYTSPLGHYRSGCTFTQAANGAGMQTFAADGMGIAIFNAVRATDDPAVGSVLLGTHILNQIHDEMIGEWPDDELSGVRAQELSDIMQECMEQVVKDVKIEAEPALMRRWYKKAEPVFVDGELVPWEPKKREG